MSQQSFPKARRPRADGERNRLALIAAAKDAFADGSTEVGLERIAREAGVGIGTLYRHFPNRDALIEAVYRQEVDALVEAASDLAASEPPLDALRAWLLLFVAFLETKRGISGVLETLIGGAEPLYSGTPARLSPPIAMLVAGVNEGGEAHIGIEPLDLLRAIVGVATVRSGVDWKAQACALVDLLLKGAEAAA
jgi:AcrR family transcriptional regulator